MSFTVADVVLDVREEVSDTAIPLRYSDDFLVRKVNQIIRRAAIMRPDLFTVVAPLTCVAGSLQTAPASSIRIMDVLTNSVGATLKEVNQEVLDLMVPDWETMTAGPAENWMRYPRDPNRFYIYPPAAGGESIGIIYSSCPSTLALGATIPMQDVYMPLIVDGTIWLVESIDAEHVESGRAKMFQDSFNSGLAAGLSARRITDTETAAGPKDEAT